MTFESMFVNPRGRTPRGPFVGALLTLAAVIAFYALVVKGLTAQWCMVVLLYPAFVLLARRLHDMGKSAWPLILPLALNAASLGLHISKSSETWVMPLTWAGLAVAAAFSLWGLLGKGQAEPNKFGEPIPA